MAKVLFNDKYVDLDTLYALARRCILSDLSVVDYLKFKLAIKGKASKYHSYLGSPLYYKLIGEWPDKYTLQQGKTWK